jgi:signal transduction histidine kinase
VASRLALLVAVPAIIGLTFAGLQVSSSLSSSAAYAQVSRNAALAQQVTGLAQALEAEQAAAASFVAQGRPAASLPALDKQYASTGAWARRVRRQAAQVDRAQPPARTRASTARALASLAALPALRRETAGGPAAPLAVTSGYATAIAALFPVVDDIGDLSDNAVLITSVRALGSLARLTSQVAQQHAILGAALAAGRLEPAALTALAVAQAQEGTEVTAFQGAATTEEGWALTRTLAGPQARQAAAVEQRAVAAGPGPLALGPRASGQWQAGMSYTLGWLRHAGQQLTHYITVDTRNQQRGATTSALLAGGAGLAGLILTVLLALLIVRSVVRPLRRLEAAALEAADHRLPAEIRALTTGAEAGLPALAAPIDVDAGGEIGEVARAFGRLHAEAVRMAGEEARLRDSVGVVVASFFRRSHHLYDRLLRLVDGMELAEEDPERLARLFEMDNLATRMRRYSDTALVLAGHETPRRWTDPVPLVDVLRAAASEIEHYDQISIDVQSDVQVDDEAAVDIVHLLAELLENATEFSPDGTPVSVSGFLEPDGEALIDITDTGPGLPDDFLGWLNWQLAHPQPADATVAQRTGLFAVAHLAARHGISVVLTRPSGGGTTAEVRLPPEMVATGSLPWNGASKLEATTGTINGASAVAADPHHSAPQLPAGPPAAGDGGADVPGLPGPDQAIPDGVPLTLSAPVLSPAAQPDAADQAPSGPLPIFDSIRSELPRRVPQPGPPPDTAGRDAPPAASPESARAGHHRLASFQQGSRRARVTAQLERDAEQTADGD